MHALHNRGCVCPESLHTHCRVPFGSAEPLIKGYDLDDKYGTLWNCLDTYGLRVSKETCMSFVGKKQVMSCFIFLFRHEHVTAIKFNQVSVQFIISRLNKLLS
jgi:hypothetical protein